MFLYRITLHCEKVASEDACCSIRNFKFGKIKVSFFDMHCLIENQRKCICGASLFGLAKSIYCIHTAKSVWPEKGKRKEENLTLR